MSPRATYPANGTILLHNPRSDRCRPSARPDGCNNLARCAPVHPARREAASYRRSAVAGIAELITVLTTVKTYRCS